MTSSECFQSTEDIRIEHDIDTTDRLFHMKEILNRYDYNFLSNTRIPCQRLI